MRSGELQTGKKRGKPSENATNDALWEPPGSSGTFFACFGSRRMGFQSHEYSFFFVLILSLIQK